MEKEQVIFQDYIHPNYSQLWIDFLPYMSVIDLLFNHGTESKNIIMQQNISREEILEEKSN